MKLIGTVILFFITVNAFCCVCRPLKDFENKQDLAGYDFVALAVVKSVAPRSGLWQMRLNGDIGIQILEQFKGEPVTALNDPSFNSDCAMTLAEGEQWIFFGNKLNGKVIVSSCSYSVVYRDVKGIREWQYFTGIKQLSVLRTIFEHPVQQTVEKQYYPDGRLEIVQRFQNAKLNGLRHIYYPDGKPFVSEEFKDGMRVGRRYVYRPTGQLVEVTTYKNGLIKGTERYQDTAYAVSLIYMSLKYVNILPANGRRDSASYLRELDSLRRLSHWDKQLMVKTTYSSDGRSYKRVGYSRSGKISFTENQDWHKQLNKQLHYRDDGKFKYNVVYNNINNTHTSRNYNDDGSVRDFLTKCDMCFLYFDPNKQPAAQPEPIYLQ